MTIDGVASYGEIYSENLTDEDINNFDDFGVEWRGRNIYAIRDDFCINAIVIFTLEYLETARNNPAKLPELEAKIIEVFKDLFESEDDEDDDEPSPLLYRFDPISGTYLELIGAEKKVLKQIGKGFKKAGKIVEKGYKKAEKGVTKGVRETGRWVRENPGKTALIVAGTAAVILTGGAVAGAFAGADAIAGSTGSAAAAGVAAAASSTAGSNNNRRKDPDDEPSSSSTPNHPSSQWTSLTTSSSSVSTLQPFNTTSTYTPNTSQGFSTSTPLPQDPFPRSAFSNHAYEMSVSSTENPHSYPSPTVTPVSLASEYKTYSTPASTPIIPQSSTYVPPYKGSSTLTHQLPKSTPPMDRYHPIDFSMSQPNGINSTALHSSLIPGYQEPQAFHLSSTTPKAAFAPNQVKEEPWTDFVKGVSTGFPRGCVDSVKEIPSTVSTIAKVAVNYALDPFIHPLQHLPGQETVSQALAVYETIAYLRTCEDGEVRKATGELIKAVAPEAHKLFTDWDKLSIQERSDLSAYCLGKYGTDFLLPIAAAKGAKVVGGVLKEAAVLGKLEGVIGVGAKEVEVVEAVAGSSKLAKGNVSLAEQQAVLEKTLSSQGLQKEIAVGNSGMLVKSNSILPPPGKLVAELNVANIQELIRVGQKTPLLAKELGFSGRDISHLTQTGSLEKTVAEAFENIVRDRAMLESLDRFRVAEEFLKPYRGQYLFETQAKELIHQTGIRTYPRPTGIPDNFVIEISKNGAGIKYVDPSNPHTYVRVMPGKPHSPFPHQRMPYVNQRINGKSLDKKGRIVPNDSTEAHIPLEEFSGN